MSSSGTIIRSPEEMENFSKQVEAYQENMHQCCTQVRQSLDAATAFMADDTGLKALEKLSDMVDALLSGLPETEQLVLKLRKSKGFLDQAQSIRF